MVDDAQYTPPSGERLVLVTGPSGAGRSTAINALEDIGYEAIDNMPLLLLPRLLDGGTMDRPLALGIDARNRDFSADSLIELIHSLACDFPVRVELLFLDASREVLLRRFSETRRRHPLAPAESPAVGIERELDLLHQVRACADILLDTSDLTPHDLRREIQHWFAPSDGQKLAITVQSFSYKRGIPRSVDMVFDCRFLKNPYWQKELRALDGRDGEVAEYVCGDPRFANFYRQVSDLMETLLPAYIDEGKAHFSIGFGCTGGQHRSVTVAEQLANALAKAGWLVSIRHREIERRASAAPVNKSG